MVAMNPQITQMIKAEPSDPLAATIPVGETKIPDPIIVPVTSEMPPNTVILRCSRTPSSFALTVDDSYETELSLRYVS